MEHVSDVVVSCYINILSIVHLFRFAKFLCKLVFCYYITISDLKPLVSVSLGQGSRPGLVGSFLESHSISQDDNSNSSLPWCTRLCSSLISWLFEAVWQRQLLALSPLYHIAFDFSFPRGEHLDSSKIAMFLTLCVHPTLISRIFFPSRYYCCFL